MEQGQSEPEIPDSRELQANERTLLAWIRTALGLLTFGFVIARLGGSVLVGAGFVVLGLIANAFALIRYRRAQRALLRKEALPRDAFPLAFGLLVGALGLLVGAHVLGYLYRHPGSP